MKKAANSVKNSAKNKQKTLPRTRGIIPHRFPKGVSGNPSGRPKNRPITDEYQALAKDIVPVKVRNKFNKMCGADILSKDATWACAAALNKFIKALFEKTPYNLREIREAIEGKARIRLELTGADGGEIINVHTHYADMTPEQRAARREDIIRLLKEKSDEMLFEDKTAPLDIASGS